MIPHILEIGPFPINSFGLMMVCCFLAAARRLALSLKAGGERPELAEPMIFWAAVGGLLGARVLYVITFYEQFLTNPLDAVFSGAGFIFYGGFLGGVLGVYLLLRKERAPFFRYADLSGACLALGYAVGRIGCHLSGDGDYGAESNVPWAVSYAKGVYPTPPGVTVHPTPIYESLAALVICAVLLHAAKNRTFSVTGQLFGLYLVLTAFARFFVEFLRIEPRVLGPLTQAQLFAMGIAAAGAYLMLRGAPRGSEAAPLNAG